MHPLKTVFSTAFIIVLLACSGSAQTGTLFKKAPAGVEEALRARVTQFFDLQSDNKFRAAESLVCDDTKDYYYNLNKKSPRGYEIDRVIFDDGFAAAEVVVTVGGEVVTIAGVMQVKAPVGTRWRLENSNWCYYIPDRDQKFIRTPFGEINVEEEKKNRKPGFQQSTIKPVTVGDLQRAVSASAQTVIFDATKPAAAEVEFTNTLPGVAKIALEGVLPPGIKVKITPAEIKSREAAKVRFEFTPGALLPEKQYVVMFTVEPTRQQIPMNVVFELSEEVKKSIPVKPFPKQ